MAINRDKILRSAEKLVQKGKVEQAIKEYQKLLKANPNDANTINRIGDLYGRIGQIDKAIELYEKIADNFTEDGFATKAIAILKKINRLAPQRLDIFSRLAELYIQQGLMVEAKNQFQILADWYIKADDSENAIKIHERLIQLDPNNHMAHLRLADLLMQASRADEAIEVYDRLGRLLLEREKLDEAERLYRHALDAKPPAAAFVAPLCAALLDAGRNAPARDFLNDAIAISPESHELHVIDVRVCLAFGNADLAAKKADMILAQRPDDVGVRLLVGQAMITAGQAAVARDLLIPAAEGKIASKDFAGAQEVIQGLVKAMPQDQKVLETAVRAFEPSGDSEMAFTLKAALADSLFRSGQHDASRAHYNELIKTDPGNKFFKQRMAQLDGVVEGDGAAQASPPPAIEPVPKPMPAPAAPAPAVAAPAFNPAERLAEATVFAKYGLVEKAQNHLEEIVSGFPEHVEARERLALLVFEAGDTKRAAEIAGPLAELDSEAWQRFQQKASQAGIAQAAAPAAAPPAPAAAAPAAETADDEEIIVVEIDDDFGEEIDLAAFDVPVEDEAPVVADPPEEVSFAVEEQPPESIPDPDDLPAEVDFESVSADSFSPREDLPIDDDAVVIDIDDDDLAAFPTPDGAASVVVEAPAPAEIDAEPVVEVAPESEEAEPELEAAFEPVAEAEFDPVIEPEAAPEPEPAAEVVVEEPAIEVVAEPEAAAPPAAVPEASGALSQIDELERLVGAAPAKPAATPAQPPVAEVAAPPAALAEESAAAIVQPDDMVEISDTFDGPPLSELQQIDFFVQQELHEDAIRMLGRLESEYPNDPEVAQRRLTLKSKGVLLDEVVAAPEGPEDLFAEEDDFFDLARELEEELAEEEAMVDEATGVNNDEAELEEVFREFQKGVAEQLSEEDSDTHFNLGIAYKEMGLQSEAIREFQVASRDPEFFVECCSMIAVCYVEQGLFEQAAEWYSKALGAPDLAAEANLVLSYDLASALESAGDPGRAIEIYQQLTQTQPGFRDVEERITQLSGG